MRQLTRVVRAEVRTRASHPSTVMLLTLCLVVALFTTSRPTVVEGNDLSLGWSAALYAFDDGSVLACLIGPLLVFLGSRETFDEQMGEVRFLCGTAPTVTSLAQLVVGVLGCLAAGGITALLGAVGGAADWLFRQSTGASTLVADPSWEPVVSAGRMLAVAGVATGVCWLACLAFRSGVRALLALVLLLTSWVALLSAVNERDLRPLLVVHPLAGPWRILDPISAPSARVEAPPILVATSLVAWSAVLVVGAVARSRRL